MTEALKRELNIYIEKHISDFHNRRIVKIKELKIRDIIKRKNPYLFKAKNLSAPDLVKNLIDAYISSQEEGIFGAFLEQLAIFVCENTYGGRKSGIEGIDLEFEKDEVKYLVSIKSGPNWGNASQRKKMEDYFRKAKQTLRTNTQTRIHIAAVEGCCYGIENKPDKGEYFRYCGQLFWEHISGDDNLYIDIIEPLGYKAKEKNDEYLNKYNAVVTVMTRDFIDEFCNRGIIDWQKILTLNSGKKAEA